MNPPSLPSRRLLLALSSAVLLAGCGKQDVVAYQVPKEKAAATPAAPATAAMPADHPPLAGGVAMPVASAPVMPPPGAGMANTAVATSTGAGLAWTAPAHWQSKPASAMRKATYTMAGDAGATAELSITAFPGDVGGEVANVNRWRGQVQLAPLADAEVAKAIVRLQSGGLAIGVVDFANPASATPLRIVGAMVPFEGATWFFKLTGSDALVAKEKPAFLEFLKTLKPATP